MKITVNAKEYELESTMSVAQFIEKFGYNPKKCVVELNGNAMRYTDFADILLENGDVLEVMSLVAGG